MIGVKLDLLFVQIDSYGSVGIIDSSDYNRRDQHVTTHEPSPCPHHQIPNHPVLIVEIERSYRSHLTIDTTKGQFGDVLSTPKLLHTCSGLSTDAIVAIHQTTFH